MYRKTLVIDYFTCLIYSQADLKMLKVYIHEDAVPICKVLNRCYVMFYIKSC